VVAREVGWIQCEGELERPEELCGAHKLYTKDSHKLSKYNQKLF